MKKNRHRMVKSIGALVLALVLAGTLGAFVPKETMAAGGVAKVTLSKIEGLSDTTEFEFEMYKVGHFSGPGLVLEDEFKGSNADVSIPKKDDYDPESYGGKTWENAWLDSANTLATYINSMQSKPESIGGVHKLTPGGSFSQAVPDNGLYLVVSKTVRDAENKAVNWTPQPMYIAILDGDSEITLNNEVAVKIVRTPVVFHHMVSKRWEIPEGMDNVKPAEINVNILYGDDIIYTVKLNQDNNWTFSWDSEEADAKYKFIYKEGDEKKVIEFTPDLSDPKWSVVEVFDAAAFKEANDREPTAEELAEISKLALRFTPNYEIPDPQKTEQTGTEQFGIVNTYTKTELELTKKLDGFVDAGDVSNVTMAFRIIAYDKDGKKVYNNVLGITFSKDDEIDADGKYTKTRRVTDIPANADKIVVSEVYASQYDGDSDKTNVEEDGKPAEIVWDEENKIWTVTMDNTHDYHQGSGVVNKYGDGDIQDQEGLVTEDQIKKN